MMDLRMEKMELEIRELRLRVRQLEQALKNMDQPSNKDLRAEVIDGLTRIMMNDPKACHQNHIRKYIEKIASGNGKEYQLEAIMRCIDHYDENPDNAYFVLCDLVRGTVY